MLILYEHMFFLSNIMFIFFVCFICFFICHPLLLWQKISRSKMAYPYHSAPAYLALRIALVRAIILLYSITTFLPLCLIMMHLQFSPKMLQSFLSWCRHQICCLHLLQKRRAVRLPKLCPLLVHYTFSSLIHYYLSKLYTSTYTDSVLSPCFCYSIADFLTLSLDFCPTPPYVFQ